MTLARTLVATYFEASSRAMLSASALHSSAPHTPRTGLHLMAHQRYGFGFRYAKLVLDSIERRAVFPSHFDDAINLSLGKILLYFGTFHLPDCFQVYAQKTSFTRKSLRHMRKTLHMAQKMGKELGKCQILQQMLQLKSTQVLTI